MTEWRNVNGYNGRYQVSDDGDVRRSDFKLLRGSITGKGYRCVGLTSSRRAKTHFVHALVMAAFVGPRPDGYHIDHIDGDRLNNRAKNLRYCTPRENMGFTVARGAEASGERNASSKLTEKQVALIVARKAAGGRYWGRDDLAAQFGVDHETISRAAKGRSWKRAAIHAHPQGDR